MIPRHLVADRHTYEDPCIAVWVLNSRSVKLLSHNHSLFDAINFYSPMVQSVPTHNFYKLYCITHPDSEKNRTNHAFLFLKVTPGKPTVEGRPCSGCRHSGGVRSALSMNSRGIQTKRTPSH